MSARFTERGSEAVNLIMSHSVRLKAKLIDQLLGEQARKSQRSAHSPVIPHLLLLFLLLLLPLLPAAVSYFYNRKSSLLYLI